MVKERFWAAMKDKHVRHIGIVTEGMNIGIDAGKLKNLTPLDDGQTAVFIEEEDQFDDHRVYYINVASVSRVTVIYMNEKDRK